MTAALLALTMTAFSGDLVCPVMGSPTTATSQAVQMNGATFRMCCAGCDASFKADPAKYVKTASTKGQTVGEFLFDPVSRLRLKAADAKGGTADYKGFRYYFATEANKKTFDAAKDKYTAIPKDEVLYCVVMKVGIASYSSAHSYVDHKNTRYYMCCSTCKELFEKSPAKYTAAAKGHVKAAKLGK